MTQRARLPSIFQCSLRDRAPDVHSKKKKIIQLRTPLGIIKRQTALEKNFRASRHTGFQLLRTDNVWNFRSFHNLEYSLQKEISKEGFSLLDVICVCVCVCVCVCGGYDVIGYKNIFESDILYNLINTFPFSV